MSKGLSTALLVVGVLIILVGAFDHFGGHFISLHHGAIYVGVVGLVVAAVGAFGFLGKK